METNKLREEIEKQYNTSQNDLFVKAFNATYREIRDNSNDITPLCCVELLFANKDKTNIVYQGVSYGVKELKSIVNGKEKSSETEKTFTLVDKLVEFHGSKLDESIKNKKGAKKGKHLDLGDEIKHDYLTTEALEYAVNEVYGSVKGYEKRLGEERDSWNDFFTNIESSANNPKKFVAKRAVTTGVNILGSLKDALEGKNISDKLSSVPNAISKINFVKNVLGDGISSGVDVKEYLINIANAGKKYTENYYNLKMEEISELKK